MTWLARLASGRFGPSQSLSGGGWLVGGMGGLTESGVSVSEFTALNLPAVYACVNRIANGIAMLPFNVYRYDQAQRRTEQQPVHRVARLLKEAPNPFMTPFTFKQTLMSHALLWGNGYCEHELNGRGEVIALWPLLPDATRPYRKPDSLAMIEYRTSVNGQSFTLGADQIGHIRALGHDGYIGYSPISLARQAIGMGLATERFGAKFFANEARSGGFIQHPMPLSPQAQKNLQESVNAQGGLDNAHRIKVLEEGAKFIATTVPPEDAQFLGTRSFQIAEFARMYNVPLTLLQEPSGTSNWGAGIEQLMIAFVVYTLGPWIQQIEEEFNRKLFTADEREQGYYIKVNTNALLRGDMAARMAFYRGMREIGVLNGNEVREFEDFNRVDGLDTYYRPSGWVPADAPAEKSDEQEFREDVRAALRR